MHWRERDLYEIIMLGGKLKTSDIISRSRMCKVTALKYLKSLKDAGYIDFEQIGPTKLYHINQRDVSLGGGRGSSTHLQSIFKVLQEFEQVTGKKGFVLMSAEDCDAKPMPVKVTMLEDGTPNFELQTEVEG